MRKSNNSSAFNAVYSLDFTVCGFAKKKRERERISSLCASRVEEGRAVWLVEDTGAACSSTWKLVKKIWMQRTRPPFQRHRWRRIGASCCQSGPKSESIFSFKMSWLSTKCYRNRRRNELKVETIVYPFVIWEKFQIFQIFQTIWWEPGTDAPVPFPQWLGGVS